MFNILLTKLKCGFSNFQLSKKSLIESYKLIVIRYQTPGTDLIYNLCNWPNLIKKIISAKLITNNQ